MGFLIKIRLVFRRNKLLILIVALAFFTIVVVSSVVAYALLVGSPELFGFLRNMLSSSRGYIGLPPPYTSGLYRLIFLNNIGHFWDPTRAWVWVPLVGAYSLGFELLLNATVIGAVISLATMTRGAAYTIAGLTPHGILEIPAFILEFAGLARWHVTTTRAIYTKLSGRKVDRPLLMEGLEDTLYLSIFSVAFFAAAAYVETFVTPRFLGL